MRRTAMKCPVCGGPIILMEWVEHHPYGMTTAGEPMADVESECDCELTDEQFQSLLDQPLEGGGEE